MKNKPLPLVSIIIITSDDANATKKCLTSLLTTTDKSIVEIHLIDNHSSPAVLRLLRQFITHHQPWTIFLHTFTTNTGYAVANNYGATKARGRYLIFLNNDTYVTKNWLNPLIASLDERLVGACQPKLRSIRQSNFFDYGGGSGGFIDRLGFPFTRGRIFYWIEKDEGQYDSRECISWACGTCLGIRKSVFEKVGGFDDYFFAYGEDVDLCLRLQKLGYTILCQPKSVVYHLGAMTSHRNLPFKIYLIHRNHLYLFLKHYARWRAVHIFGLRLLCEGGAALFYISEGRIQFIRCMLRAYRDLIISWPMLLRKCKKSLKYNSGRPVLTYYRGSIVWDYFIRKKLTYREIMGGDRRKIPLKHLHQIITPP